MLLDTTLRQMIGLLCQSVRNSVALTPAYSAFTAWYKASLTITNRTKPIMLLEVLAKLYRHLLIWVIINFFFAHIIRFVLEKASNFMHLLCSPNTQCYSHCISCSIQAFVDKYLNDLTAILPLPV